MWYKLILDGYTKLKMEEERFSHFPAPVTLIHVTGFGPVVSEYISRIDANNVMMTVNSKSHPPKED